MTRRGYTAVNLPDEVVTWLDAFLPGRDASKPPGPLGIRYRDEFVRTAVAIFAAALFPNERGEVPLQAVRDIVERLKRIEQSSKKQT